MLLLLLYVWLLLLLYVWVINISVAENLCAYVFSPFFFFCESLLMVDNVNFYHNFKPEGEHEYTLV